MTEKRNPVESVASDFIDSIRQGREQDPGKAADANPEIENELKDLLPVIQQLENARKTHAARPGGYVSLGAERPKQLGDFQIVRQIGRGGMGVVFEAIQKSLNRKVALKVLPRTLLVDEAQHARFEREAKTAASLHHTNIVPVFGVGEDLGFHYFVMQRIEGRGLDQILTDGATNLTPTEVARLGSQAAEALAYAHANGVLHRDIKPANLIVDDQSNLWVADFGVAKAIESEAMTRTGDVVGTLRYIPPEQILGESDVRSDIYSLGVTLYEALAGRPAFDDESVRHALVKRSAAPVPPPLRQLNPSVPRDLETILHAAMSPLPDDRYATAAEMHDDLQRFLDGQPIRVRPLSVFSRGWRWARKYPAISSLTALSALLLVSVAAVSSFGYLEVQNSLERATTMQRAAESNALLASDALDEIFQRFAGVPVTGESFSTQQLTPPVLSQDMAELLEELLPYYDALATRDASTIDVQESAARGRWSIGDVHYQLGQYDESIQDFQEAMARVDQVYADPIQQALYRARGHNQIGLAYRMLGRTQESETEHERAIQMLSEIADDPDSGLEISGPDLQSIKFETARAHYLIAARVLPGMGPQAMPRIGPVFQHLSGGHGGPSRPPGRSGPGGFLDGGPPGNGGPRNGRPPGINRPAGTNGGFSLPPRGLNESIGRSRQLDPKSEHHVTIAIKILRELRLESPDATNVGVLFAACLRRGAAAAVDPQAFETESLQLLRELHKQAPHDEALLYELTLGLSDGDVFQSDLTLPELEAMIDRMRESLPLIQKLSTAHPNVARYTQSLIHTHFKLGVLLNQLADELPREMSHGLIQEAGSAFQLSALRQSQLLAQHPDTAGYQAWLGVFWTFTAANLFETGAVDQAAARMEDGIDLFHQLETTAAGRDLVATALAEAYRLLTDINRLRGDYDAAEEARLQADLYSLYRRQTNFDRAAIDDETTDPAAKDPSP